MNNLSNFGVQELNAIDIIEVNGGGRIKTIRRILEVLGVVDALQEFAEGFAEGCSASGC